MFNWLFKDIISLRRVFSMLYSSAVSTLRHMLMALNWSVVHQEDLPGDFHMTLLKNHTVRVLSLCGLGVKAFCCWLKGGQWRARTEMFMGIGEFGKGLPHCIQQEMGEPWGCSFYSLAALLHKLSLKRKQFWK